MKGLTFPLISYKELDLTLPPHTRLDNDNAGM